MPGASRVTAVEAVRRMTNRMRSRGPDAYGEYAGEGIVLGHRRLAIVDLDPRANQPMQSFDGRFLIVFNGEIYNFRELRRELEADGFQFRTTSDTEVLLTLFGHEGERMLPRLRGMFAFAIWDTRTRELFLARDPYGIKPLFYAFTRDGLAFASQVKALQASGLVQTGTEAAGLAGFYLWGSVPEPWTLYRDVMALPAGHSLRARAGAVNPPVSWYDIRAHWQAQGRKTSPADLRERVRQAVSDSVRAHLLADVPVSVFLSGGIDSGVIAGVVAEAGARIEGITVGFEEFAGLRDDETPAARAVAKRYGLPHHVRIVSRVEFEHDIPRIVDAMDQPSIDGINTWFVSKAARELGLKVAISGLGGDELFGGYPSFREIPKWVGLIGLPSRVPGLGRAARALGQRTGRWLGLNPKAAGMLELGGTYAGAYLLRRGLFMPWELRK